MVKRSTRIGFIGLGTMGAPIAGNFLRAGFDVVVYNRTGEKARSLVQAGAQRAEKCEEVARCGVVFTMVSDDAALEAVSCGEGGIVGQLGKGGIHASLSTIAPETANRLARLHEEYGEEYVAVPVFGRPDTAKARELVACIAGGAEAKDRVQRIMESTCSAVYDFGVKPGAANVVKLAGNFLMAAAIEGMAEAFTVAEKGGVSRGRVFEVLSQTLFSCPVYHEFGECVAKHRYDPAGFFLSLGLKDLGLVRNLATRSEVPMPLANLLHDRLLASMAKGREHLDWSALALEVSEAAGLAMER